VFCLALTVVFVAACGDVTDSVEGAGSFERASAAINAVDLQRHIEALASDRMLGRAPATPGEERTVEYLVDQYRRIGLAPAGPDGYLQAVPLAEITGNSDMSLTLGEETLRYADDFVARTPRMVKQVELRDSELVFAGYGIVAPEYDWNDYAGVDWHGKTAVVLVNDPGFASGDPTLFNGRAMTYYGRWTYKFEEAARQGAAGLLIVHQTEPAAYGWDVVRNSNTGPQIYLASADGNAAAVMVEGWLQRTVAERLFTRAGHSLDQLQAAALDDGFQPVSLGQTADLTIQNTIREYDSYNVIGAIPGVGRTAEYVVYTAHWDHLGQDPSLQGDQIYNGAADNASGVAAMLEIARAHAALEPVPERSVLFAAVTAEESGLLGSLYFAQNPVVATRDLVAVLNMDIMLREGPEPVATVIGIGQSDLGVYADSAAQRQGRTVRPHPAPESGYFYRSDHFSLAKYGVPGLAYLNAGASETDYVRERYHKTGDEFDESWDLGGAVQDAQLFFDIGYRLATSDVFPAWRETSEFRAARAADGR